MGTGGLFLRKVRARVSDQPTGFVWVERGKLSGSGYPASRKQLEWVKSQGIDVVVTLTEEPLPDGWLEGTSLIGKHIPMKDHGVPDAGTLEAAASYLQSEIHAGKAVVVHCLAGEGRTGCVLGAYLMKEKGIGAKEALEELRRMKPAFVERNQEKSLLDYESRKG